jgi:phage replication-related protein YjqB (UPF0714/DUF867 family)
MSHLPHHSNRLPNHRGAYASFDDLKASEAEGRDFQITVQQRDSGVAVVAIHGGGIEPGTSEIAAALAGDDHALYCFEGIKPSGNRVLHLPSVRFDEPRATALVIRADTVVAIHGCRESHPVVYIGGLDADMSRWMIDNLRHAGFPARKSRRPGLGGIHPNNICNRGRSGRGVQVEISAGLRREMITAGHHRSGHQGTERFPRFVALLRIALAADRSKTAQAKRLFPP